MMKNKTRILRFFTNRYVLFAVILVGFLAKLLFFPFRLSDYEFFLEPWVNFIKENGYFHALKHDFHNYPPAYIYLLVLIAKTGIYPLFPIKLVSVIFEYAIAFFVGKIAYLKYPSHLVFWLAFAIIPIVPSIFINAAYWGQCDSIYTTFVIGSIYFILQKKPFSSVIFLGLAFCFKMQSAFILPFFFVQMLRGNVKWYYFLAIPVIYFISVLPAWFFGGNLGNLLTAYIAQANHYDALTLSFPNIYIWIDTIYTDWAKIIGCAVTALVTIIVGLILRNKKYDFTLENWIQLAFLSAIITPFILPGMHERYLYVGDVLGVVYLLMIRKNSYIPLGVWFVSLCAYMACSRFRAFFIFEPVFFIYLTISALAVFHFIRSLKPIPDETYK